MADRYTEGARELNETSPADRLTENDVVEAVCTRLRTKGFEIKQRLTTMQTGDDIIAARGDELLYIEAKGATSARKGSARHGKPFDSAQVRVHVAEAVYRAVQILSRTPGDGRIRAGIALPANNLHRRELASVSAVLRKWQVAVFWVRDAEHVDVE